MPANGLGRGEPVWRQFHDEWRVFAFYQPSAEHAAHDYGHGNAYGIEGYHDEALVAHCEECAGDHYVDGQARRTAHHRQDEHGDKARTAALDGARGHDGRHIAAEAHDERDERLAVQAHLVHELIHDECSPRHVAGVFHERYEAIKNEYLWKEHYHSANAAYHAVCKHGFERAVGEGGADPFAKQADSGLNPVHGVLPKGECHFEHHV